MLPKPRFSKRIFGHSAGHLNWTGPIANGSDFRGNAMKSMKSNSWAPQTPEARGDENSSHRPPKTNRDIPEPLKPVGPSPVTPFHAATDIAILFQRNGASKGKGNVRRPTRANPTTCKGSCTSDSILHKGEGSFIPKSAPKRIKQTNHHL